MKRVILISILTLIATIDIASGLLSKNVIEKDYEAMIERRRKEALIGAIMMVESGGNTNAYNKIEEAVGVLQIRPIMLREVNRVLGYKKYKLKDRWDKNKSIQMFTDYQNWRNPDWNEEVAARVWNGGHRGDKKKSSIKYWIKVQKHLQKQN